MGPERKDKLRASEGLERMRQDTDSLLVTSRRLLEEMHVLLERAQQLLDQHSLLINARRELSRPSKPPAAAGEAAGDK